MKHWLIWTLFLLCLRFMSNANYLQAAQKENAAVLPFVNERASRETVDLFAKVLVHELSQSQELSLLDMDEVKNRLANAGYPNPSCFDINCARSFGQALNASRIVIGRITKTSNRHLLELRVVNSFDQREMYSKTLTAVNEDDLFNKLSEVTGPITHALRPDESIIPQPMAIGSGQPITNGSQPPSAITIIHQPIQQIPEGQDIQIQAQVQPSLGDNQLFLVYRTPDLERSRLLLMTRVVGNEYFGQIPSVSISGPIVEYYIQTVDANGNETARYPVGDSYITIRVGKQDIETPYDRPPQPIEAPDDKVQKGEIKKKGGSKLLIMSVGALAIGAGTYYAIQQKDKKDDTKATKLPGPPDYP
jgi:TolB-like protein